MNNVVYVLVVYLPYETAVVLGVYTDKSLAETEKSKAKKNDDSNGYNDFEIEEFKLDDVPEIQALMNDAPVNPENREIVPPVGFEATLLLLDIFNCDDKDSLANFLGNDIYNRMDRLINEKD